MKAWSFSGSKSFRRCARQWFLRTAVANARAKSPAIRREAYILSKLDSVYGWRGRLVDLVISGEVVNTLRQGRTPRLDQLLTAARALFDAQLAFARAHRIRERGLVLSKCGDKVAAFRSMEYGGSIADAEIESAWADVSHSLENLLGLEVLDRMRRAQALIPQRRLQFTLTGVDGQPVPVQATPDLIVFTKGESPLVVDWKVHTFVSADSRLQLAIYALALVRAAPHRDFPSVLGRISPTDVQLVEAQLLANRERRYALDDTDVVEAESYIGETAELMALAVSGVTPGEFSAAVVAPTRDPMLCTRCPFERICWGEPVWRVSRQMSLL
jgi:PD-(D/E)XK nuclease superfamily protein